MVLARQNESAGYTASFCSRPQFSLVAFETALSLPPALNLTPEVASPTPARDIGLLVSIWGNDAAQCDILQEQMDAPFILTLKSFDQHETHCSVNHFREMNPGGWQMSMSCSVEGRPSGLNRVD